MARTGSVFEGWGTNVSPLEFVLSQFSVVEFSLGGGIVTTEVAGAGLVSVSCHWSGGMVGIVRAMRFGLGNRDNRSSRGRTTCAAWQTRNASFGTDADASFA